MKKNGTMILANQSWNS